MSYQIHVVPYDSQWLERYAYKELGTRYADDRARYTESNSPFIQEMLEQARIWGGGRA